MLRYVKGNLVDEVTEGIVLHGTNCYGVMGTGIAKQLRDRYPKIFPSYKKLCDIHGAKLLGEIQLIRVSDSLLICNGFTQSRYGRTKTYSSTAAIEQVLNKTAQEMDVYDLSTLHTVKLGCNNGGLDWEEDVQPVFQSFSKKHPHLEIILYEFDYKNTD